MGLTSEQYDEIMREYDRLRLTNEHIHKDRMNTVYSKIPEYQELEDKVRIVATNFGKRAILGDKNALFEMRKTIDEIEDKKQKLLQKNGFDAGYVKPIYSCSDCKDTGYTEGRKCHCLEQNILTKLYSQSNIESILEKENFDTLTFDYYSDEEYIQMKDIVDECRDYVAKFDREYKNIIFTGKPGVGKTFLSNCIAKALLDTEHSVIYFTSLQMFDTLSKYTFENNSSDDISRMREDILSCDLLIIDDLGTEISNSFITSQLFFIINDRDLREKSTIISTNLSLSELSERYTERITSRIFGKYSFINPEIGDIRFKMRKL